MWPYPWHGLVASARSPLRRQLCDQEASLRDNVINLLLTETGRHVDEPSILLQTEFREPAFYSSILAAAAGGRAKKSEIAGRRGTKADGLGPYLAILVKLDLISNTTSLDADEKSRNRRYTFNDRLIAFWHSFVRPNLTAITSGFGGNVYDSAIRPRFSEYMGTEFDSISLDYAKLHIQEVLAHPAQEVGQIWGHADFDIDTAGRLLDGTYFYGECNPVDLGMIHILKDRAEKTTYGQDKAGKQYLFFSRAGSTPDVTALAEVDSSVHLIDLDRLVLPPENPAGIG